MSGELKLRIEKKKRKKECQNSMQNSYDYRKNYKLQHKTANKLTAINLQSLWVSRGDGLDIPSLVSTM